MRARTTAAAAAALALTGLGLLGPAATAAPPEAPAGDAQAAATWYREAWSWHDPYDKGGVGITEMATKGGTGGKVYVYGRFVPEGEHLFISDRHANGRKSIVKLWVGGSGPAVFYSKGDNTYRDVNLSYDEGQTVYLQACTSDSAQAVCTKKVAKGTS